MKNLTFHSYIIECITNLHVGSGDNDYGVVDKQVQRDPVTQYPTINASSLKGAFREFFKEQVESTHMSKLFGTDKNDDDKFQGCLRFFSADLLALPVQNVGGNGNSPYTLNYNQVIKDDFENKQKVFHNGSGKSITAVEVSKAIQLANKIPTDELPIIARNSLDNGQSQNLWYEEIVPRKTLFYFSVAVENAKAKELDYTKDFENNFLSTENKSIVIQIGANATVGNGYCKITKI